MTVLDEALERSRAAMRADEASAVDDDVDDSAGVPAPRSAVGASALPSLLPLAGAVDGVTDGAVCIDGVCRLPR